jgi:nitrogen fixation/metabolism regulation signal transduction histidine kinase
MFLFALKRNFIPLMVGLAMVPVFVYDTIRVTNRFAGPIARLRETLRDISSGSELRELKLRQGDYWSELAQEFNQAMRRLTKSTAETSK